MDVYTYHYSCPTWWGNSTGIRNIYVEDDTSPVVAAQEDAKTFSGAKKCDVHLIQKFKMSVTEVETYPAMACQPLHKWSKTH
jgi:hypothetical protein